MSGDQERLKRIAKLADAAILMDEAARTLFLHGICQDDGSLMAEIESEIESREVASRSEPVESELDPRDDLGETSPEADGITDEQANDFPPIDLELDLTTDDPEADTQQIVAHVEIDEPDGKVPSRLDLAVAAALETTDPTDKSVDPEPERNDHAEPDTPVVDVPVSSYEPDLPDPTSYVLEPDSYGSESEPASTINLSFSDPDDEPLEPIAEAEPDFEHSGDVVEDVQIEVEADGASTESVRHFTAEALWDLDLAVDDASAYHEHEPAVDEVSLGFEEAVDDVSSEHVENDGKSTAFEHEVGILAESEVGDHVPLDVESKVEEEPLPTEPVGQYRLVEYLGRGRTSQVYVGERVDLETDRKVAIKLFDPGHGTDSLDERFYFEGNILASLEHPGIAQFIDGNVSDAGQVYLVMELVRGATIDQFADDRNLGERDRLRLFQEVCQIVHAGHQHLVIHCDLKPSNVRVSEIGEVKLLDFGIAKLIDPESAGDRNGEDQETAAASEYASPEQLSGKVLTTVSDVYSLGVLLHKLLTGKLPKSNRPGTEITGRKDLDTIILRCLREDPPSRYGSAEALGSDIQRYLDRVPVEAHPDSFGYRVGKLMSRHKLAFGAGATAVVLSLGFAATMALGLVGL